MKQKLLVLFVTLLSSVNLFAYDFEVDGIYYNILPTQELTCEITKKISKDSWVFTYSDYSGDFIIPSSVTYCDKSYSVTTIGVEAFYCSNLTSVEIPSSITTINDYAFYGCTKLESIDIPISVISIGRQAFYFCESLTSVVIPNSVTMIGTEAFYNCFGLTSMVIGNSLTKIDFGVFRDCYNMTSVEIGNSVSSIVNYAFEGCNGLTSVVIPNSVTEVEHDAFFECYHLTSIVIGSSVTSIGNGAFDSEKITEITSLAITPPQIKLYNTFKDAVYKNAVLIVPDESVDAYKKADNWKYFLNIVGINGGGGPDPENNYILYTSSDGKIVEPCKTDGFGANIVSNTYENGQGKIVFDGEVTSIGPSAFSSCKNLKSIEIPNSVISIGTDAFYNCEGLTYIEIPASVETMGLNPFRSCWKLSEIKVLGGNNFFVENNCLISKDGLLIKGANESSVTIPGSVTEIGEWSFSDYYSLRSVVIPNSVVSIGRFAFYYCKKLASVEIPNSVIEMGDGVFYSCFGLKSIEIPNSVTEIKDNTFHRCTSLTSIEIGSSVNKIGKSVFGDCGSLKEITAHNPKPAEVDDDTFSGVPIEECTLKVPAESVEAYKAADGWKEFENIEAINLPQGDVTGDGEIDINDVVTIVAMILDDDSSNPLGDLNGDGEVDVLDIVTLVGIILDK